MGVGRRSSLGVSAVLPSPSIDRSSPLVHGQTGHLIEVRPSVGATTRYPFVTLEWAEQWPCEEVWKARKSA